MGGGLPEGSVSPHSDQTFLIFSWKVMTVFLTFQHGALGNRNAKCYCSVQNAGALQFRNLWLSIATCRHWNISLHICGDLKRCCCWRLLGKGSQLCPYVDLFPIPPPHPTQVVAPASTAVFSSLQVLPRNTVHGQRETRTEVTRAGQSYPEVAPIQHRHQGSDVHHCTEDQSSLVTDAL